MQNPHPLPHASLSSVVTSQRLTPMVTAGKLLYGFTGQPLPTGGEHLTAQTQTHNRRAWANAFGMPAEWPVLGLNQVHGKQWLTACASLASQPFPTADAWILDAPGTIALVQVADCVPVLLYCPQVHAGAVIHAGWKGTAQGIVPAVIQYLVQHYGVSPASLIMVTGPSISQACYEVSPEVESALQASLPEKSKTLFSTTPPTASKPYVDVALVNRLQAQALGVEQIEPLPLCTFSNPQAVWSYRRGDWQRQGLIACLL
jgi:polyphenol oxidase